MSELEKIKAKEKALKEKKKKVLAKEYEKLGKAFYKTSKAKSFPEATAKLQEGSSFSEQTVTQISERDLAYLRQFADELTWNEQGQYWRTDNIKNLTQFLATFRSETK